MSVAATTAFGTIGTAAALMHILMGDAVNPREAGRLGLVHERVSGKALDRAMEIARRLASRPPGSVAAIKRLVRNAIETPRAQGLAFERNLFLKTKSLPETVHQRRRTCSDAVLRGGERHIAVSFY